MEKELFNDLISSCNEAIEHSNGNMSLRSNVVTIPDDDIITKFGQLDENDKYIVRGMIERLLIANK